MTLDIDGMHCDACVRRVTQALEGSGAGRVEEVKIGTATVDAPPESATTLVDALSLAGFTARVQP